MIADVFRDTMAGTSRRLLLTSGIPALAFSTILIGITLEPTVNLDTAIASWSDQPASSRTIQVAGFVLAVTLITALLAANRVTVLRWAEGYWPGRFGKWLGRRRATRHERTRADLRDEAREGNTDAYETLYLYYPLPGSPVLPTRLGNVLRSAEDYPRTRYGIDAVLVWPRLFPFLPASFTAGLASSRARLDAALASAALSVVFAIAAPIRAAVAGSLWLAVVSLAVGVLGWLAAYRAALTAALAYGQQIRAAFDLYRGLLLDTAQHGGRPPQPETRSVGQGTTDQLPFPAHTGLSSAAERAIWEGLCGFWYRNIPIDARVTAPLRTSPSRRSDRAE